MHRYVCRRAPLLLALTLTAACDCAGDDLREAPDPPRRDAAAGDAAPGDGSNLDASNPDVSLPDSSIPDSSSTDASIADASITDAAPHDAEPGLDVIAPPDAGPPLDVGPVSCPSAPTTRSAGDLRSALPALTWWGGGYTIAIDQVVSEMPFVTEVFLEQTDAKGQRIAGPTPLTPSDGQFSLWPRIAFSGIEYGVTYLDGAARSATFVRADAQLRPIPRSTLSLGAGTHSETAVAWGHGSWGVAWSDQSGSGTIHFQRLDPAGSPLGAAITVGSGWLSDNGTPMIATAAGWAIVSTGAPVSVYEIDLNGSVRAVVLPFNANRSSIASDGTQYAVIAGDNTASFARVQIGGGVVAGSVARVGSGQPSVPNVIFTAGQFLLTWSETTAGAQAPLKLAVVSPALMQATILGASFTTRSNAGFHHLLAGGCGWAVVYQVFSNTELAVLEVRP